ncbi:MAG: type II toxin-antitoxin system prevent-host-death family antitoxin [Caldilineaceae bacterium]
MNTKTVDVQEAQTQLAQLLALALEGNDVVITEDNVPLARLVPVQPEPLRRVASLHKGAIRMQADFNEPLPDEFWLGAA